MKKLFVGIAATALAAAMCVSFAACGEKSDAKSIKGVEVTAEQWDAAFEAFSKADAEYSFTATTVSTDSVTNMTDPETNAKLSGSRTETMEIVYSKKGNKESYKTTETTQLTGDARKILTILEMTSDLPEEDTATISAQTYVEKTADGYVIYEQIDDGTWKKEEGDTLAPRFDYYKSQFDNYVYSEEYKGYIPKDYSAEDKDELEVIKFDKDGKLIAMYHEYIEEGEADADGEVMSNSMTAGYIFEYEVEDFNLPTVA